jgi:hypothetical protein
MPKRQQIRVVKLPPIVEFVDIRQSFPRMQTLYLELLENKSKVKQDLINKDHVPSSDILPKFSPVKLNFIDKTQDSPDRKEHRRSKHKHRSSSRNLELGERMNSLLDNDDEEKDSSHRHRHHDSDDEKESDRHHGKKDSDRHHEEKDSDRRHEEKDSDRHHEDKDSDRHHDKKDSDRHHDKKDSDRHDKREKYDNDNASDVSSLLEDREPKKGKSDDHRDDKSDTSDLSDLLRNMLNDDESVASFSKFQKTVESHKSPAAMTDDGQGDKYSRHRDDAGKSFPQPPTLAELQARGGYIPKKEMRDVNHTTMTEHEEEDSKRKLLFRFDMLRKAYPHAIIPDYTVHTDYRSLERSYEDHIRKLSLEDSVGSYKKYLLGGFMACEFLFGHTLGFDMQGFTQQQMMSMSSYEKLLIELGEKSYVPSGSKWPVEIRLLGLIIVNAAIFMVSKMIMKKTGSDLMGMMNVMTGGSAVNSSTSSGIPASAPRKRRMKGPNVDLSEIPDGAEQTK